MASDEENMRKSMDECRVSYMGATLLGHELSRTSSTCARHEHCYVIEQNKKSRERGAKEQWVTSKKNNRNTEGKSNMPLKASGSIAEAASHGHVSSVLLQPLPPFPNRVQIHSFDHLHCVLFAGRSRRFCVRYGGSRINRC